MMRRRWVVRCATGGRSSTASCGNCPRVRPDGTCPSGMGRGRPSTNGSAASQRMEPGTGSWLASSSTRPVPPWTEHEDPPRL
ncbi:conserved hypothetical protein [Streptomyces sp. Mg1]|nr:conserved hypothetical protein [Streptomyces sp. Mg1]